MPRFYFNLYNDIATADVEGREMADLGAARSAAERDAREMAARSVQCEGYLNLAHYVEVTDESGKPVLRVPFGEAVVITGANRVRTQDHGFNQDQ